MAWPIAAAIGLTAASALGNYMGNKADAERASAAYDTISGLAANAETANNRDIAAYKDLVAQTYGQGNANYTTALNNFLSSPVYQNEGFSFTDDISNYMDPYANQRAAAAMQAIENSAAANGSRFSSSYLDRVGAKQQALASEEWEKSYDRLMQARNQALAEYNVNSQNNWNNYNATNERAKYAVDAYGRDRDAYVGGLSDALSASIANRTAALESQAETLAGTANANKGTSGWNLMGGLGGAGSNFMDKWFNK